MKRDALIACLEAAKELHSKQWAQTSVEIAFEVCGPLHLFDALDAHLLDLRSTSPNPI